VAFKIFHFLPVKTAQKTLLLLFSLILVFHTLVLVGYIPFQMVWGGRLKSYEEMLAFETISILLNFIMLAVIAIDSGLLRIPVSRKVLQFSIGIMAVLFAVNTVGNIFSVNEMEKLIFTPVTAILSVLCIRLLVRD